MIRKDCPLNDKEKLFVILHHECTIHTHPNCLKGCSLFKKRFLKAEWSVEMATDIKAMHGMNIEDELVKIMSEELTKEIDNEFIRRAI